MRLKDYYDLQSLNLKISEIRVIYKISDSDIKLSQNHGFNGFKDCTD